jgi:hypothetical protein
VPAHGVLQSLAGIKFSRFRESKCVVKAFLTFQRF